MKQGRPWIFSKQASRLGGAILSDSLSKRLIHYDKEKYLNQILAELNCARGQLFLKGIPLAPSRTHNVDFS